MAGEIEEPFRLNFQADLLHSGSISFGRFESESLSWERRSIFSHNRYLEEVEKYSKPGSVTEKKAYFEAEFKRKALLKQRSLQCQDVTEFPTSINNDLRSFEESGNGERSPCSSDHSECNTETEIQHYEKEDIISQQCESQICEFLPVGTRDEPVINVVDCPVSVLEFVKLDETHQSIGVTFVDDLVLADVSLEAIDSSLTCQTPAKDRDSTCSGPRTMFSPKVKLASEKKHTTGTLKTRANVDQFEKQVSNEASKGSMKPKTSESKGLIVKKTEKKSPRPASPFTYSGVKTSKAEDATSSKEKELRLKKSIVKDLKSEKAVKTRFPSSEKSLPCVPSSVNRSKPTISLKKTPVIQSAAGLSLKTDQRAENRKEEKQAAEMKQYRKSLNFKAKPMPAFDNESARGSDHHKVKPISKTPNQPRPSSQSISTRGDKNAFKSSSIPSSIRPSSATSTNKIRHSQKKEQEKKKEIIILEKQKETNSRARDTVKKPSKSVNMNDGPKSTRLAVGVVYRSNR